MINVQQLTSIAKTNCSASTHSSSFQAVNSARVCQKLDLSMDKGPTPVGFGFHDVHELSRNEISMDGADLWSSSKEFKSQIRSSRTRKANRLTLFNHSMSKYNDILFLGGAGLLTDRPMTTSDA
jgi:hypothetical protein